MASLQIEGMNEMIHAMSKLDLFDDEMKQELLYAAGDIAVREIWERVRTSEFDFGGYKNKIKYSKKIKRDKNNLPYVTVTVSGKNANGVRRNLIVFVMNYGRSKEYGQIVGTYFWNRGSEEAIPKIKQEFEKVINEKLRERGLL